MDASHQFIQLLDFIIALNSWLPCVTTPCTILFSSYDLASAEIYPNPASNVITVSNAEGASVEVFNLLGQVMTIKRSIDINEVIDLTTLSNGTYLVKITKGSQTATQKLVVLK